MDTRRQKRHWNLSKSEKYTLQEACAMLRISVRTALRWIKTGKMVALRPGHRYLITEREINRLLGKRNGNEKSGQSQNT
jgi:excisionase family DNA binding protein